MKSQTAGMTDNIKIPTMASAQVSEDQEVLTGVLTTVVIILALILVCILCLVYFKKKHRKRNEYRIKQNELLWRVESPVYKNTTE